MVRQGGKFTSITDTVVAPSGHKLADLLFKVAAHRLQSHVARTPSFDQVGHAVNAGSNNADGRIILVR